MKDTKNSANDEVDILELSSKVWRGIRKFIGSILGLFIFCSVFAIKRVHWLILFTLLGVGTGFLMFKNTDRIYSSEMIVQPNGFTSVDMAQYINDIHEMCQNRNIDAISNAFNISHEKAVDIINIEAFNYIDVNNDGIGDYVDFKQKFDPYDSTTVIVMNRLLIKADVLDNQSFDKVREGLIQYINKNSYLLTVNDLRKRELRIVIDQTDTEISKLDSLQNIEYYLSTNESNKNKEGQIVILNEKQTQLYYVDKVSLLNHKIRYQRDLELATDPITIIKDFAELQFEENPVSNYLIVHMVVWCILGYLLLLFLNFKEKVLTFIATNG